MSQSKTIHTSRTIMFTELAKVMDFSMENDGFIDALHQNITGKKSSAGVKKTAGYLKRLYGFNKQDKLFVAFKYFWKEADSNNKPLLAFLYAINNDSLLAESIHVLQNTKPGEKVSVELFEENIEKFHPNLYSVNTKRSVAQNMASSWKQAGFIAGKVKNIRMQPDIDHHIACFAFLLAYLKGARGEFIWNSTSIKALCLSEKKLRELAIECTKRNIMQYQYAGSVTVISFNNLLAKIGIDAI